MRAPDFWGGGPLSSLLSPLLSPLSLIYGMGVRLRFALTKPTRVGIPVVCVGNLVAGGAGKTPVALAIGEWFQAQGCKPHFLSRGYGGSLSGPVRVDAEYHHSHETGDEALLLSRIAPTWLSRDRPAGASAAAMAGADVVIMDDGFQNPSLNKDLSLLVIDGEYGIGNGRLIPAGPLRENMAKALSRANAVVVMGDDTAGVETRVENILVKRIPILGARLALKDGGKDWQGRKVLAFAGIGRPEKFFNSLRKAGAEVVVARAFPDHYPYDEGEVAALVETAEAAGAEPVTTAKDAERLPVNVQDRVRVFRVHVQWQDEAALARLLSPLSEGVVRNKVDTDG